MSRKNSVSHKMVQESVAMTRDFIREFLGREGFKNWTAQQQKLLSLFLAKLKYDEGNNDPEIQLTYDEIIKGLGWEYYGHERNMREKLFPDVNYMMGHCKMCLKGRNKGLPVYAGNLISGFKFDGNSLTIIINWQFMVHLENLFDLQRSTGWRFMIMPLSDLQLFHSKYSEFFFFEFITCGAVGGAINSHQLSTKEIKYLVGLSDNAYMRKGQTFDRCNFEKRVLIPAMKDIEATEMVDIIKASDGEYFEKIKVRGKVVGYRFRYRIYTIQQIFERRTNPEKVKREATEMVFEADFEDVITTSETEL